MGPSIYLVAHNIRSCYNVGSLLRTADAMGVLKVFLTGYTPYPAQKNDDRPPHIAGKLSRQIEKTALGAEKTVSWDHREDVFKLISELSGQGVQIVALEQTKSAQPLPGFRPEKDVALVVGREVEGLESEILDSAAVHLEIPMLGNKESLNVASAAAIALYQLRFPGRR